MSSWITVREANVGDLFTAAWVNEIEGDLDYLHGGAGAVQLDGASTTFQIGGGFISSSSTIGLTYVPAAPGGNSLLSIKSGDAVQTHQIEFDGTQHYGAGGSAATDVLTARFAAALWGSDGDLVARHGAATAVQIGAYSGTAGIIFGSDTYLYKSNTGSLLTPGTLFVNDFGHTNIVGSDVGGSAANKKIPVLNADGSTAGYIRLYSS